MSAALAIMAERGYRGMSIPAVAEAAGVGKPTIYLRFPSKFDLAVAAVASLPVVEHPPDTGSARADLVALLQARQETIEQIGLGILGTVLTEEVEHPDLLERFRVQVLRPGANAFRIVLQRGIERGELSADADVDVAVDLLDGSQLSQYLQGGPLPRDWAERAVDAVWASLEPKSSR